MDTMTTTNNYSSKGSINTIYLKITNFSGNRSNQSINQGIVQPPSEQQVIRGT